jgi:hypothetical protein
VSPQLYLHICPTNLRLPLDSKYHASSITPPPNPQNLGIASTAKNTTSSSQTSSKSRAALSTLVRPSLLPFPQFFFNSLFTSGDDPFWEAVDIWYSATVTTDQEWYDPEQLTTRNGSLVITLDSSTTTQAGLTPGTCFPSFLPFPFHSFARYPLSRSCSLYSANANRRLHDTVQPWVEPQPDVPFGDAAVVE